MNLTTKNIKFNDKERNDFLSHYQNLNSETILVIPKRTSLDLFKIERKIKDNRPAKAVHPILTDLINDIKNMVVFDLSWSEIKKIKSKPDNTESNLYDVLFYYIAKEKNWDKALKPIINSKEEKSIIKRLDKSELEKLKSAYNSQDNKTKNKISDLQLWRIYYKATKKIDDKINKLDLPSGYEVVDELTIDENNSIDYFNIENIYDDFNTKDIRKYHKKDYKTFTLRKKNGKIRTIESPNDRLNLIQKCLNIFLQLIYQPDHGVHGFIKGRNVKTNASKHVDKKFVYNIDLKNFFPSVKSDRIIEVLNSESFNLNVHVCKAISKIACLNNNLPQGAPTSPVISNIVCQSLDRRLLVFSRKYKSAYSRYADDITFSNCDFEYNNEFHDQLKLIIEDECFKINEEKTRLQKRGYRQEVTGLIVNEKVNVRRSYVKEIRSWLHQWEVKSNRNYADAQLEFLKRHTSVHNKGLHLHNYSRGKLDFLKMIRGENDLVYKKYKNKFDELHFLHLIDYKKTIIIEEFNKKRINERIKNQLTKILDNAKKPERIKNDKELTKINEELKKIIENKKENKKENIKIRNTYKNSRNKYKSPKKLATLLKDFNKDPILKHFEHPIDSSGLKQIYRTLKTKKFDFETFLMKAHSNWEKIVNKHYTGIKIHMGIGEEYPLINLINTFIGNNKKQKPEASLNKIIEKINWGAEELENWSINNPGMVPNPSDELKGNPAFDGFDYIEIMSDDDDIYNFTQLTYYFKSLIRFKSSSSLLSKIKNENKILSSENSKINIKLINEDYEFEQASFRTDTNRLIAGYNEIIKVCSNNEHERIDDKNPYILNISIKNEKDKPIRLYIHSENTKCSIDINRKYKGEGKFTESIIEKINGIADLNFYFKHIDGNVYKRELWPIPKTNIQKINEPLIGVKYELIIYKE